MIREEGKGNREISKNSHFIEVQLIYLLCTMKIKKKCTIHKGIKSSLKKTKIQLDSTLCIEK